MSSKLKRWLIAVIGLGALAVTSVILYVQVSFIDKLAPSVTTQEAPVALVLGASINSDGTPSDALRDRLLVGKELYQTGKVRQILLTGDGGEFRRDEIAAMKAFMVAQGVPAWDILEDREGFRTYESCKRAVQVFGIKKAIVVTQRFHIGRALYLCNNLGMDASGVTSDLQIYRRILFFWARDLAASVKAWVDINVLPPSPPFPFSLFPLPLSSAC